MSLQNYLRTDDRHLQSFTSVPAWRVSEPEDISNHIGLGLTNNPRQNVSASCGRYRSWICHTGIQVKLWSDMASPSNTGLRTFISFMTVPGPCLRYSSGPGLLWGTWQIAMTTEILSTTICLQYTVSCIGFYRIRPQHHNARTKTDI